MTASHQAKGPSPDSALERNAADVAAFVAESPSSYHAVATVRRRLLAVGYQQLHEHDEWAPQQPNAKYLVVRDGAIIAWHNPADVQASSAFAIVGSHTDCTGFKLKPQPTTGGHGFVQAGVEVYGGPLLNAYLDRDLGLAGRLVLDDGREVLTRLGAMLRIPQLAIHLDRKVNEEGAKVKRQAHTQPIWALGSPNDFDLLQFLAAAAQDHDGKSVDVQPESIAGYDIYTYDTQAAARLGVGAEFFASGRLDNLASVQASVATFEDLAGGSPTNIAMLAAFDHEEIGSSTRSGACGPLLADVIARIQAGLGASVEEAARGVAGSWCLSSDCGHSVHPNYPERHDPQVRPVLGGGVLLKINADQRYATDAHGAALVRRLATSSGCAYQEFVSHNDLPCGSTIGPLTATRLGIRTVDVGIPLLSMHSPRELAAVSDMFELRTLIAAFVQGPLAPKA